MEATFENNRKCAVVVTFSYSNEVSVLLFDNWDKAMSFVKKDIMEEYYMDIEENDLKSEYEIREDEGYALLTTHYSDGPAYTGWKIATVYDPNERD